ncbi:MAG: peptidase of plants and bacteria-domain-containing protein [Olpidium bornovanus]|uniref:Peptidase of plants and bacteria-domain-containing protein n=1 Tax=Olpidium bornovanus TaxID=278681 RepID=A0A8H7ZU03_9FUNG|nr:MAG: peptidase of plants and bacteria-domain-containing protein [Olpidium bornovanus]
MAELAPRRSRGAPAAAESESPLPAERVRPATPAETATSTPPPPDPAPDPPLDPPPDPGPDPPPVPACPLERASASGAAAICCCPAAQAAVWRSAATAPWAPALPFPAWPAPSFAPPSAPPATCVFRFRAEPESAGELLAGLIGDPVAVLAEDASRVLDILYPYPFAPFRPTGGGRKRVTLVFREFDGIAHTTRPPGGGSPSCPRCAWCEIHLNARYALGQVEKKGAAGAAAELRGIVAHELAHVFLADPSGPGPAGNNGTWALSEGVADFARLRAGLVPAHWRGRGAGGSWADGYHTTAYFLDWIDRRRRPGFVAWLCYVMGWQRWFDCVWTEGAGAPVNELWEAYQAELLAADVVGCSAAAAGGGTTAPKSPGSVARADAG